MQVSLPVGSNSIVVKTPTSGLIRTELKNKTLRRITPIELGIPLEFSAMKGLADNLDELVNITLPENLN